LKIFTISDTGIANSLRNTSRQIPLTPTPLVDHLSQVGFADHQQNDFQHENNL
jgi:hypothetical protein